MKNEDIGLLIGGAVVLYLIVNNQGASAAQAQINASNLQAQTNVNNANLIANSALTVGQDLNTLFGSSF